MYCLCQAVALEIRICRLLNSSTLSKFVHLLVQEFPVESIRMVEVNGMAFLFRHVARIIVIGIQWHNSHIVRRQSLHDLLYHGSLARASTTSDSNDCNFIFVHDILFCYSFYCSFLITNMYMHTLLYIRARHQTSVCNTLPFSLQPVDRLYCCLASDRDARCDFRR